MRAVDVIARKRDGEELSPEQIQVFVRAVTDGSWPEYQISALLMAIVLRGMTAEEITALTEAMVHSGVKVDLSHLPGHKVDKHSTGGVGDKTSLILAPLAAACGVVVPMMSGRALGHTGGTLDKLEAIPGFRTGLLLGEFQRMLADVGVSMIGQTAEIAPADKKLYALRDVTSTVESIPLITASIMSKKIAEGIDALVLDVKAGRGAFMKTTAQANLLAQALVQVGNSSGVRTEALLTSMDAPLGRDVGNALEVIESIETLKGRGPRDLEDLSVRLAARMVVLAGLADSEKAETMVRQALTSGAGLEVFRKVIAWQGGDPRVIDDYGRLPTASRRHAVMAPGKGYVSDIDPMKIARAAMRLGAGRDRVEDKIDPAVGVRLRVSLGDRVEPGQPLAELHYNDSGRLFEAAALAAEACTLTAEAPKIAPRVLAEVV
jgi:pyrimidine-nucleoside phosphorylase